MGSANRVAFNTFILYTRMLITMGITLYSTRLILYALGNTDFGIYNLISGVISMLSFLNTAMATSTQRYLSFHKGKNDLEMQKRIFTNSVLIHLTIAVVMVVMLEIIGQFLFRGFLNIPANRIYAAQVVYHLMAATVFFTIIVVPFIGTLIANENMLWIAAVNIIETVLKLAVAILLFLIISNEKLIVYSALIEGISMCSFVLYAVFCFRRYKECTWKNLWVADFSLIKGLGSFAGWNLFGSLCTLARAEGLAIVLNLFFGAIINAAYGIANQVSSQLNFFSVTMLRVLNPQIMKSEGANHRKEMLRLSMIASKFGFFLLAIFAIPCIFEMPAILHMWLKTVPANSVIFCCLILVGMLVNQLTIGLQSALQATGRIRLYQITVGSLLLINLPLAYFLLKFGYPPYSVFISYAIIEFLGCCLRLYLGKKLAGLIISDYFSRVFACEVIPVILSVVVCYLLTTYLNFPFRFLMTGVLSAIVFIVSIYVFGLYNDEKAALNKVLNQIKIRIKMFNK